MNTECDAVRAAELFDADTERVLRALSDADRRFVVARLVERSDETAVADLATELAAWRGDGTDDLAVESAHTALYHNHVPKLEKGGIVEYDRGSGTVELAVDADAVDERVDLPDIEN